MLYLIEIVARRVSDKLKRSTVMIWAVTTLRFGLSSYDIS